MFKDNIIRTSAPAGGVACAIASATRGEDGILHEQTNQIGGAVAHV